MTYPEKPGYEHADTGSAPPSPLDYANGDAVEPEHFDYYWNTNFEYINLLIDALSEIDSDNDGRVDAAESADESKDTLAYKGNDIDGDGDGIVDATDEVRGLDGDYHAAGSLPVFTDVSTGLNQTSEGDIFYNQNTNEFVENTG